MSQMHARVPMCQRGPGAPSTSSSLSGPPGCGLRFVWASYPGSLLHVFSTVSYTCLPHYSWLLKAAWGDLGVWG